MFITGQNGEQINYSQCGIFWLRFPLGAKFKKAGVEPASEILKTKSSPAKSLAQINQNRLAKKFNHLIAFCHLKLKSEFILPEKNLKVESNRLDEKSVKKY